MQEILRLVWIICRKNFIKFFCGGCHKTRLFLLYMCTEYKPGTPERHRTTAKAAPDKTNATGQPERRQGGTNSRPARQRAEPKQQRPHLPPNVQISPTWTANRRTKAELAVTHAGRAYATMACSVGEDVLREDLPTALNTATCIKCGYAVNYTLKYATMPLYWPATWWKLAMCVKPGGMTLG